MSLLCQADVQRYAMAHGRVYDQMCDEPGCGKLIRPGELYIVLKYEDKAKRTPKKIRCMTCERDLHPPKEVVSVKGAGRSAKKVSQEVAAEMYINPIVRKVVMRLVKNGIEKGLLKSMLRRKKAIRELKAKEVSTTIRNMRKLKMFRSKENMFVLPKQKKAKKVSQ